MVACRKPCPSCPWRVEQDASEIPNFSLELAEGLAATSPRGGYGPKFGAPIFACHQSRIAREVACAGWLAAVGNAHPNVRLMVLRGEVPVEALAPGADWPLLHGSFDAMIVKLRATAA